jgi:hypothetical protein
MVDVVMKQASLALDAVWRQRVQLSMMAALVATQAEAIGGLSVTAFNKRKTFATAALNNPAAYVDRFAWAAAANATIGTDIQAPVAISSSTNANPIVVTTAAAHGYVNGDTVEILGHLVNTAANGGWIVTNLTSTTFSIPTAGVGVGGATGTVTKQPSDNDLNFTVNSLISDFAGVTSLD